MNVNEDEAREEIISLLDPDKKLTFRRLRDHFTSMKCKGLPKALASLIADGTVVMNIESVTQTPFYELATAAETRQNQIVPRTSFSLYPTVERDRTRINFD